MALIGQIRRNPWILIVAIGLGLGGFLLMDMNSATKGPGNGMSQMIVGKVNGEKIRRTKFESVLNTRYNGSTASTYENRNQLWSWFVEDELLRAEGATSGLGVSADEINELEFGTSPSPIIQRNFQNPQQPGQLNREQLDYFKQVITDNTIEAEVNEGRLSPQFKNFWLMQREMIVKDRMQSKLQGLVQKSMYTPTWMAEMGFAEQNQRVGFTYVKIPYDNVAPEEVSMSDSDLSSYLSSHKALYERKNELRTLDYVVFDVAPTAADSAEIRKTLVELLPEFTNPANGDSIFVLSHNGIITPAYRNNTELGTTIADTVLNLPKGALYGPYEEAGELRVVKVLDKVVMADSADTRHILLSAQTPADFAAANERADSIINVLQSNPSNFEALVTQFSQDPGSSENGGLYENVTPNQFVPEYNEILFITGKIGAFYKVRTNYGVHVVEVVSRSSNTTQRAQIAYIAESIIPSKDTQDDIYQTAAQFIGNNKDIASLRSSAAAAGLKVVTTPAFDNNAYTLGQLGFSNETKNAVCWSFSSDEGDVSPNVYAFTDDIRYYDNKYVVVALNDIMEAGTPSVDEIRSDLETAVINTKKAEIIQGKINGTALAAIASQFNTKVDTLNSITFASPSAQGLGNEPKVIAAAIGMEVGQTSAPIEGEGGVFVISVTSKPVIGQATNLPQIRQSMSASSRSVVNSSFMSSFAQKATVDDNRASFDCN